MSTLAFPDAVLTPLVYLTVIFALCVRNQPLVTGTARTDRVVIRPSSPGVFYMDNIPSPGRQSGARLPMSVVGQGRRSRAASYAAARRSTPARSRNSRRDRRARVPSRAALPVG